jgi:hypothetical protein
MIGSQNAAPNARVTPMETIAAVDNYRQSHTRTRFPSMKKTQADKGAMCMPLPDSSFCSDTLSFWRMGSIFDNGCFVVVDWNK